MTIDPEVVLYDGVLQNKWTKLVCNTGKYRNLIKGKIYEPYTCSSCKNRYGEWVNCGFGIVDEDGDAYHVKGGMFSKVFEYRIKNDITDSDRKYMKRLKQRIESLSNHSSNKEDVIAYLKGLYDGYKKLESKCKNDYSII